MHGRQGRVNEVGTRDCSVAGLPWPVLLREVVLCESWHSGSQVGFNNFVQSWRVIVSFLFQSTYDFALSLRVN